MASFCYFREFFLFLILKPLIHIVDNKTNQSKMVKATEKAAPKGGNKWLNFLKSYREKNATKAKGKQSEILKEAGRLWKEMSDAEKSKYATATTGPAKK